MVRLEDASTTNNLRHPGNLSAEWRSTISEKMAAAFVRQPAEFWVAKMRQAGVPFSLCRTSQERLHAAEVEESALSVVVEDPVHGPVRQFGLQTTLGRTPDECLVLRSSRPSAWRAAAAVSASRAASTHSGVAKVRSPMPSAMAAKRTDAVAGAAAVAGASGWWC